MISDYSRVLFVPNRTIAHTAAIARNFNIPSVEHYLPGSLRYMCDAGHLPACTIQARRTDRQSSPGKCIACRAAMGE